MRAPACLSRGWGEGGGVPKFEIAGGLFPLVGGARSWKIRAVDGSSIE